jgi:hypothetical protein
MTIFCLPMRWGEFIAIKYPDGRERLSQYDGLIHHHCQLEYENPIDSMSNIDFPIDATLENGNHCCRQWLSGWK